MSTGQRFGALPCLRITRTKMDLPCCGRIAPNPGATSEATLRVAAPAITSASCAFKASISAASSIDGNSSARLPTIIEDAPAFAGRVRELAGDDRAVMPIVQPLLAILDT